MSTEFAEKYSYALYEVSKEKKDETVQSTIEKVKKNLENQDLRQFLMHPQINKEIKKETLERIYAQSIPPYLLNFLYVLVDNNRIKDIDIILKTFEDLCLKMQNIKQVTVISAMALSEEKLQEIGKAYQGDSSGKIQVKNNVDPSIIGGIILKVEDQMIDQSIRGQLERMEKKLQETR